MCETLKLLNIKLVLSSVVSFLTGYDVFIVILLLLLLFAHGVVILNVILNKENNVYQHAFSHSSVYCAMPVLNANRTFNLYAES